MSELRVPPLVNEKGTEWDRHAPCGFPWHFHEIEYIPSPESDNLRLLAVRCPVPAEQLVFYREKP